MAPFNERRETIRIGVNGNMNIESVAPGQALRLIDIGVGGFRVQSVESMLPDVVTSYRFVTPDGKWSGIFRARTIYCKLLPPADTGAQHLSGLTFVNAETQAVQRQLMALIDHATAFISFS